MQSRFLALINMSVEMEDTSVSRAESEPVKQVPEPKAAEAPQGEAGVASEAGQRNQGEALPIHTS